MAADGEPLLLIAEVFGPTLQGEGPSTGRPAMFVRLSRCNLSCTWCDTPETWDTTRFDLRRHTTAQTSARLAETVLHADVELVVITGGEPLIQQRRLVDLLDLLLAAGRRIEIETNGTITPEPGLIRPGVRFNVSPKLPGSGLPAHRRLVPTALKTLAAADSVCKFVIAPAHQEIDLAEADAIATAYPFREVWLMPEATTHTDATAGLRALAEPVLARGWALSPRLHITLWEGQPGR
ncbi:organic radical activating enzyme [Actinoalloteichus hoggarensis]|nr:7-carboxy-7-deazaguanine synthase QueE [Actinoalloteichus hoggarensis]MBB5922153.1 organic radical activating enzyme [Actinoalloteichus hoggarensis]